MLLVLNTGWRFSVLQVKTYFASDDTGLGLSMGELCTHIIDVLTSSRSDEELQNEVSTLDEMKLLDVKMLRRLK